MPRRSFKKKSKFVTRRALPFLIARQAEAKYIQRTVSNLDMVEALPETVSLTSIGNGDLRSNRIGNEIQVTGIYARGFWMQTPDATFPTDNSYYGRVVLYTPKDQNDTLDVIPGEVIDKEQFTVWYDRLMPIPWTNSISNSMFTIKKSFKPYMKVTYNSSSANSETKNAIKLLISTNSGTALVTLNYQLKMYFRDL